MRKEQNPLFIFFLFLPVILALPVASQVYARWSVPPHAALRSRLGADETLPRSPLRNSKSSRTTGGPDNFGYTWDDTEPFSWVDATAGNLTGLDDDDDYIGPITIGFPFKYYENTYTGVYISTNGTLSFGSGDSSYENRAMPDSARPQNIIAALWDDLAVGAPYNNGNVYTLQGGTQPNRYLVVEWHQISTGGPDLLTFEVILHENGDLVIQFQSLSGTLTEATVGIEDDVGVDGLTYLHNVAGLRDNLAVRFTRPAPSARVKTFPLFQSGFVQSGAKVFQFSVRNTGESGTDTYNLSLTSNWSAALFHDDGITPLTDTDNDSIVDTGQLAQGDTITITAKIQAPSAVAIGSYDTVVLTATSSLSATKSTNVTLQSAVPTQFVQGLTDGDNGALSFHIITPEEQTPVKVSVDYYNGQRLALALVPNNKYFYTWEKTGFSSNFSIISNIEYALVSQTGQVLQPIQKLTDNSSAILQTTDQSPILAAAPNGHIGIAWIRIIFDGGINAYNYNVFFTVINTSGALVAGPINLTNNDQFAGLGDLNIPVYSSPHIATIGSARFLLTWVDERTLGNGEKGDIQYTIYDSNGNEKVTPTFLTTSTPGAIRYIDPFVAALRGSGALLTYSSFDPGNQSYQVLYQVLDSSGNTIIPQRTIPNGNGWRPAALQLPSETVVVAWAHPATPVQNIAFATLDSTTYNLDQGPTDLSNAGITRAADYVSITTDQTGRAILTWMDDDLNQYLVYALLDGNGTVLTPATIYYEGQNQGNPSVVSSYTGQGNQPYLPWFIYLPLTMR